MGTTTFSGPVVSENGFEGAMSATTVTATSVASTSTVTARSASALVAGGASAFIGTNTAAGMGVYFGSGAPTVAAAKGSIYLRSDGSSTSTRLYVSDGGTTWISVTTAS